MRCRLFERDLNYIVNHAEDDYIILDLTFVHLMANLQHKLPTVKGFLILTDRQHMPRDCKLRNAMCYEDLLEVSSDASDATGNTAQMSPCCITCVHRSAKRGYCSCAWDIASVP